MHGCVTATGLRRAFTDVGLAALFIAFAVAQARSYSLHPRLSVLLLVVFEALFAVFVVVRRQAAVTATSLAAWLSTTGGSFSPLLLRPATGANDLLAAQAIQVAGAGLAVAGILSLNRSVGLLPANRGIRRTGAYRLVRHPLYAAYILIHAGYVANNFTFRNVATACVALAAQLFRIHGEELLLSRDPEYVTYREHTRWRLVPFVY